MHFTSRKPRLCGLGCGVRAWPAGCGQCPFLVAWQGQWPSLSLACLSLHQAGSAALVASVPQERAIKIRMFLKKLHPGSSYHWGCHSVPAAQE